MITSRANVTMTDTLFPVETPGGDNAAFCFTGCCSGAPFCFLSFIH